MTLCPHLLYNFVKKHFCLDFLAFLFKNFNLYFRFQFPVPVRADQITRYPYGFTQRTDPTSRCTRIVPSPNATRAFAKELPSPIDLFTLTKKWVSYFCCTVKIDSWGLIGRRDVGFGGAHLGFTPSSAQVSWNDRMWGKDPQWKNSPVLTVRLRPSEICGHCLLD